jgi:hypothetical protein
VRRLATWSVVLLVAAVALAAIVEALLNDGPPPQARAAATSTTEASPAATDCSGESLLVCNDESTLAPDSKHVSPADAARFISF